MLPTPAITCWSMRGGFDVGAPALQALEERRSGEVSIERFEAEAAEKRMGLDLVGGRQGHEAEAAGIVESEPAAIVEGDDDMVMCRSAAGRVVEFGRVAAERQPPRHAEMDDEGLAIVEADAQILRAPREARDLAPLETLGEARRERDTQIGPRQPNAGDPPSDEGWLEAAAHGFDFRSSGIGNNHPFALEGDKGAALWCGDASLRQGVYLRYGISRRVTDGRFRFPDNPRRGKGPARAADLQCRRRAL